MAALLPSAFVMLVALDEFFRRIGESNKASEKRWRSFMLGTSEPASILKYLFLFPVASVALLLVSSRFFYLAGV